MSWVAWVAVVALLGNVVLLCQRPSWVGASGLTLKMATAAVVGAAALVGIVASAAVLMGVVLGVGLLWELVVSVPANTWWKILSGSLFFVVWVVFMVWRIEQNTDATIREEERKAHEAWAVIEGKAHAAWLKMKEAERTAQQTTMTDIETWKARDKAWEAALAAREAWEALWDKSSKVAWAEAWKALDAWEQAWKEQEMPVGR